MCMDKIALIQRVFCATLCYIALNKIWIFDEFNYDWHIHTICIIKKCEN